MSHGPQRFTKNDLTRLIKVAKDTLGNDFSVVIDKGGTMVLQAGKQNEPPTSPAANEWKDWAAGDDKTAA